MSAVSAAQTPPGQATVTAVGGTVTLLPADTGIEQPLGTATQSVVPGDIVGVGDDGEVGLSAGTTLAARVFHASHVQIGGALADSGAPSSADKPASTTLGPAAAVYQLSDGATYNTVSVDPETGLPTIISTPGATVTAISGQFLLYYAPASNRTWLVVTDGTATVSAAGGSTDVPAAFFTVVIDGSAPSSACEYADPEWHALVGSDRFAGFDLDGWESILAIP